MKTCVCGISILLGIALLSCSKPVEPTRNPSRPVVKPAAQDYSLESREIDSPAQGGEKTPVPEGFQVTVLDDETGESISYAVVKLKWRINDKPFMLDAVNNGYGTYSICTNKIFDSNHVAVVAEGYLPAAHENARFPLTVKLKRGETVKVYGTVHDAGGNSVSGAYLAVQPLSGTIWTNDEMRMVNSCDACSLEDGRYEIPTVPRFLDRLFIRFKNNEYPMVDFTNQVFDTYGKDVCVDVVLPGFLELKGQVTYDTGDPAIGAQVWVEKHTSAHVDTFIRQSNYSEDYALKNSMTETDSNGFFSIRTLNIVPFYAVKAATEMHQPAVAGIFTRDNPAPDFINLLIKSGGARIAGKFSDTHGNPVTNVQAHYSIEIVEGSMETDQKLGLEIEPDGSYLSQIISPVKKEIYFYPPGYKQITKDISLRAGETAFIDLIFTRNDLINGIVINPLSGETVAGVTLSNSNQRSDSTTQFSPVSDAAGKFWVRPSQYSQILFSHPAYCSETVEYYSSERLDSNIVYTVYMSPETTVNVHVDGIQPGKDGNYSVNLRYQRPAEKSDAVINRFLNGPFGVKKIINDGIAVFTNIPIHCSPVVAHVNFKNRYETLVKSKPHELNMNGVTHISLVIPPMGTLVAVLAHPFNKDEHSFLGTTVLSGNRIRTKSQVVPHITIHSGCVIGKNELIWTDVPTSSYRIIFKNLNRIVFMSNVVVRAGETTKVCIDFKTNVYGSILGKTLLSDSTPIDCYIDVYNSKNKQIKGASSHNGEFIVKNLDPAETYVLKASIIGFGHTNVTVENVSPGETLVTMTLGSAFRISGNLVDGEGTPLSAEVNSARSYNIGPGNFSLYPFLPGTHRIVFNVEDNAPVVKEVTVTDDDVDLGDIVCEDKGYTLTGTIVKQDGSPAAAASIVIECASDRARKKVAAGSDGTFTIQNLAENNRYTLMINHTDERLEQSVENITSDTDLGELKLNQ